MRGLRIAVTDDGYEVRPFDGGLAELQDAVTGYIEPIPTSDNLTMWVNEDGKGLGRPVNRLAMDVWIPFDVYHCMLEGGDWIAGDCVVTGGTDADGETLDILPNVAKWVMSVAEDAGARVIPGEREETR